MELETQENLAWPYIFGIGRISWAIPIILAGNSSEVSQLEMWGYNPPKITEQIYAAVIISRNTRMACCYNIRIVSDRAGVRFPAKVEVLHSLYHHCSSI